jgi:pSer/pThr/pTyr-binding forkhead associated (FHA) protein
VSDHLIDLVTTADRSEFTFALEQKRTYTVGRDKTADIRFESRYVRLQEGTLVVGDWDPTQVSAMSM